MCTPHLAISLTHEAYIIDVGERKEQLILGYCVHFILKHF